MCSVLVKLTRVLVKKNGSTQGALRVELFGSAKDHHHSSQNPPGATCRDTSMSKSQKLTPRNDYIPPTQGLHAQTTESIALGQMTNMLTPFWGSIVIPLLTGVSAKLRTKHIQSDDGVETPQRGWIVFLRQLSQGGFVGLGVSSKMCGCNGFSKETMKTKMDQQAKS